MGAGSGALITPNQALTLMDVDPLIGGTAGGVLQTAQRIGIAIGQAVIGAVFFVTLGRTVGAARYDDALAAAVIAALGFVALAATVGAVDLVKTRRSVRLREVPSPLP
jgi:uncharacterized membrane-anchored protein